MTYDIITVTVYHIIINLITLVAYYDDKMASKTKGQQMRISENTLLFLGLIGGWVGAIIAQQRFRHKTRKLSFQLQFVVTIGLHVLFFYTLVLSDLI